MSAIFVPDLISYVEAPAPPPEDPHAAAAAAPPPEDPHAAGAGAAPGGGDDLPAVDAEAAAEAAEERANAIRPQAQGNPYEFVTMDNIIKTGPFLNVMISIPIALSLIIALVVDSPRSCDTADYAAMYDDGSSSSEQSSKNFGEAPPLKAWAITDTVLSCFMLLVNGLATRIFIKNPATPTNGDRRWGVTIIISRFLDICWFIWFIVGAVWTFQLAKHPCHYEIPFVYSVCMAIVIFGFTALGAAVLACCVVCILLLLGLGAILRIRRHQGEGGGGPEEDASRGASEEQISSMPIKTFYEGMIDAPEATCSICFGDYIPGEELRFLPCHHHFHAACVDTWFVGSKACPICKHPIDKPAPETSYNPTSDTTPGAAAPDGVTVSVPVTVPTTADSAAGMETTTTTTTTTAQEGDDELQDDEGSPFARSDSNMGTFVNMPMN